MAAVAHEGGPLIQPESCPACGGTGSFAFVEPWRDRIGQSDYSVWSCAACGVVFSEPRTAPPADWYEKAAPLRAAERVALPREDRRFSAFLSEGLAPGRVLDVGCGDGGFLALAGEMGWKGEGVDYDERVVARARERGVDATAADLMTFLAGRPESSYDAAVMFDVLEHTPEPRALFAAVKRLVRVGGHVALTLPNANRPILVKREEHDYPPHHFTRWSPEAMRGFLEKNGFAVVRQDAGTLSTAYLSDALFFDWLMPKVLGAYKRAAFGSAAGDRTVTELYDSTGKSGVMADKALRQKLVDGVKVLLRWATWPAALLLKLKYTAERGDAGDSLYTLAKRVG